MPLQCSRFCMHHKSYFSDNISCTEHFASSFDVMCMKRRDGKKRNERIDCYETKDPSAMEFSINLQLGLRKMLIRNGSAECDLQFKIALWEPFLPSMRSFMKCDAQSDFNLFKTMRNSTSHASIIDHHKLSDALISITFKATKIFSNGLCKYEATEEVVAIRSWKLTDWVITTPFPINFWLADERNYLIENYKYHVVSGVKNCAHLKTIEKLFSSRTLTLNNLFLTLRKEIIEIATETRFIVCLLTYLWY